MSFGMFPIVMYTGYTDFPQNDVTSVLSDETWTGMMVAPGVSFSTAFCVRGELRNIACFPISHGADLNVPPPLPSMHIGVNPEGHVGINVVSLRFEFEIWCKIVTAKDFCDAIESVPVEDFEGFTINCDLLSLELGAECR